MVTTSRNITAKGANDGDTYKISGNLRRKGKEVKVIYTQNKVQSPRTPKTNKRKSRRKYFPTRQTETETVMVMTGMASASRREAMPR